MLTDSIINDRKCQNDIQNENITDNYDSQLNHQRLRRKRFLNKNSNLSLKRNAVYFDEIDQSFHNKSIQKSFDAQTKSIESKDNHENENIIEKEQINSADIIDNGNDGHYEINDKEEISSMNSKEIDNNNGQCRNYLTVMNHHNDYNGNDENSVQNDECKIIDNQTSKKSMKLLETATTKATAATKTIPDKIIEINFDNKQTIQNKKNSNANTDDEIQAIIQNNDIIDKSINLSMNSANECSCDVHSKISINSNDLQKLYREIQSLRKINLKLEHKNYSLQEQIFNMIKEESILNLISQKRNINEHSKLNKNKLRSNSLIENFISKNWLLSMDNNDRLRNANNNSLGLQQQNESMQNSKKKLQSQEIMEIRRKLFSFRQHDTFVSDCLQLSSIENNDKTAQHLDNNGNGNRKENSSKVQKNRPIKISRQLSFEDNNDNDNLNVDNFSEQKEQNFENSIENKSLLSKHHSFDAQKQLRYNPFDQNEIIETNRNAKSTDEIVGNDYYYNHRKIIINEFDCVVRMQSKQEDRVASKKTYKLIMIGDSTVGKTSLINRIRTGTFQSDPCPTIGIDFQTIQLKIDDEYYDLQLWDTAGQERYHSITRNYYRRVDAICMVFDISNEKTFLNIRNWLKSIEETLIEPIPLLLIGNKCDLRYTKNLDKFNFISRKSAIDLANEIGPNCIFMETSSKTGYDVDNVMIIAIKMILNEKKKIGKKSSKDNETITPKVWSQTLNNYMNRTKCC